jgi:hypothetical protein
LATLARAVAAPSVAAALYLYTAPPKVVLRERDMAATLYDLKLVPAAHVHVGADAAKQQGGAPAPGGWLRPEVAALMRDVVPGALAARAAADGTRGKGGLSAAEEAAAARERERAVAEARRASTAAGVGAGEEGGKKVPKWLKMGGK